MPDKDWKGQIIIKVPEKGKPEFEFFGEIFSVIHLEQFIVLFKREYRSAFSRFVRDKHARRMEEKKRRKEINLKLDFRKQLAKKQWKHIKT